MPLAAFWPDLLLHCSRDPPSPLHLSVSAGSRLCVRLLRGAFAQRVCKEDVGFLEGMGTRSAKALATSSVRGRLSRCTIVPCVRIQGDLAEGALGGCD